MKYNHLIISRVKLTNNIAKSIVKIVESMILTELYLTIYFTFQYDKTPTTLHTNVKCANISPAVLFGDLRERGFSHKKTRYSWLARLVFSVDHKS